MIKEASQGEQIQYIPFKDLSSPDLESISLKNITDGLDSKQWRRNFDSITRLREANKYYGSILLQQLLPQVIQQVIQQIDNLRSNNSKEALTLCAEIIQHQSLEKLDKNIVCPIVSALFVKSTSEKAFLKKQALNGVQRLPKKFNPYLLQQISNQILSINSQISELGAKILLQYIENNKITQVNGEFLSLLIRTINGKRAVLQKKGRQILNSFKTRLGEQKLIEMIEIATKQNNLPEQESQALIEQVKKQEKQTKNQQSLKDYLAMKKKSESN